MDAKHDHSVYSAAAVFPTTSEAAAKHYYLGKSLRDAQAPAVVIDAAVARRNCDLMLKTAARLDISFRAHVKTHKTIELAQLQVGKDSKDIRLIVSTVAEAESLLPWLLESTVAGKKVNILFGLPIAPSAITRLAQIAQKLGEGSIALLIDHADQIVHLNEAWWPHSNTPVFVKIDTGYHRAGVEIGTPQMTELAQALSKARRVLLTGFYAHMGHSYGVGSPEEALEFLTQELQGLEEGAISFLSSTDGTLRGPHDQPLVLSFGATPTATATQNLNDDTAVAKSCNALLNKLKEHYTVEVHAGVYPLMDMQQLAARARPSHALADPSQSLLSFSDLGLRVLVEVASVYKNRAQPEALIAAGSIALGREPCKSYPGWGVVSSWPLTTGQVYDPEGERTGWIVGGISQEHGILRWEGSTEHFRSVQLGEKLLIWPNHACMSGPNFAFYLVVDSELPDPYKIIDIWVRSRGW